MFIATIRCDWPDCREYVRVAATEQNHPTSATAMREYTAREGWTIAQRSEHRGEETVRVRHDYCPAHRQQYDQWRTGRPRQ